MVDFNVYKCENYALSMGFNFADEPIPLSGSHV